LTNIIVIPNVGVYGLKHFSERRGAAEEGRKGQGGESATLHNQITTNDFTCFQLNFNLTLQNQDVKLKTQKIEDISAERDAFWQGKMVDLEQRLQTSEHRRQDLETRAMSTITSNSTLTLLKSENDTLKMRLMDLEEKLYRQDQQMKRRALQERTNTLTTNSSGSVSTGIHFDPADIAKPAPTLAPYSDTITASSLVASAPQRNAFVTASSVLARSQSGSGGGGGGGVDFSIFPDKQALSSRFL
jgi:hypothetical protein